MFSIFLIAHRPFDKLLSDFDGVSQAVPAQNFPKDLENSIDNGKINAKNILNRYTVTMKSVMEWCDLATPLLNQFINSNGNSKSQAQKSLSNPTLFKGFFRMTEAWTEMDYEKLKLSRLSETYLLLNSTATDFYNETIKFKEENRELFENLENKIKHLNTDIEKFKLHLKFEMLDIDDFKLKIVNTRKYLKHVDIPELHADIRESVERLIAKCADFRKKHEWAERTEKIE